MKKILTIITTILILTMVAGCGASTQPALTTLDSSDGLKRGLTTVVEYDKVFDAHVDSLEEAKQAVIDYGEMQRELYENEKVKELEKKLEQKYGILAVNLGEIDYATAKDVKKACDYMFKAYPQLRGTLTNISIANFPSEMPNALALTETREFIINESYAVVPYVVKYQILLNASKFLKRDKLLTTCNEMVAEGHWPEGTNITSLVVHELGHQLLDIVSMKNYGLKGDTEFDCIYITEDNQDGYSGYVTDSLSANQTVPQDVLAESYQLWKDNYGETGTEEEFRASISQYAGGVQEDGGISYPETVAEAVADVYLNKKKASNASKAIVDVLKRRLADS